MLQLLFPSGMVGGRVPLRAGTFLSIHLSPRHQAVIPGLWKSRRPGCDMDFPVSGIVPALGAEAPTPPGPSRIRDAPTPPLGMDVPLEVPGSAV